MSNCNIETLTDDKLRIAFEYFSVDDTISPRYLTEVMKSSHIEIAEHVLIELINEADQENAGSISFPAFRKMMVRILDNKMQVATKSTLRNTATKSTFGNTLSLPMMLSSCKNSRSLTLSAGFKSLSGVIEENEL